MQIKFNRWAFGERSEFEKRMNSYGLLGQKMFIVKVKDEWLLMINGAWLFFIDIEGEPELDKKPIDKNYIYSLVEGEE